MKTLHVTKRRDWRAWLKSHHETEKEIWLIFHKKHTGKGRLAYDDAVEEAICFGWIDSIIKRRDEQTYVQKFTPRNLNSRWSSLNVERAKKMIAAGLMTAAGLAKIDPSLLARKQAFLQGQPPIRCRRYSAREASPIRSAGTRRKRQGLFTWPGPGHRGRL
jgi:uncharacterized protein YdeI (YjbR/CyaY-like superfamily)